MLRRRRIPRGLIHQRRHSSAFSTPYMTTFPIETLIRKRVRHCRDSYCAGLCASVDSLVDTKSCRENHEAKGSREPGANITTPAAAWTGQKVAELKQRSSGGITHARNALHAQIQMLVLIGHCTRVATSLRPKGKSRAAARRMPCGDLTVWATVASAGRGVGGQQFHPHRPTWASLDILPQGALGSAFVLSKEPQPFSVSSLGRSQSSSVACLSFCPYLQSICLLIMRPCDRRKPITFLSFQHALSLHNILHLLLPASAWLPLPQMQQGL